MIINNTKNSVELLENICFWIFDLDNTIYSYKTNLFNQIEKRIGQYLQKSLSIELIEAKKIQKKLFFKYGSTLKGLMEEYKQKPDLFLDYVHDIDYSILKEDKKLAFALPKLQGKKFIYTNGSHKHAVNVINQLGIADCFDNIYDITCANFIPKPSIIPFNDFVKKYNISPKNSLMAEDMLKNLEAAFSLGMKTLFIKTNNKWASSGNIENIDFETNDLSEWLYSYTKLY